MDKKRPISGAALALAAGAISATPAPALSGINEWFNPLPYRPSPAWDHETKAEREKRLAAKEAKLSAKRVKRSQQRKSRKANRRK